MTSPDHLAKLSLSCDGIPVTRTRLSLDWLTQLTSTEMLSNLTSVLCCWSYLLSQGADCNDRWNFQRLGGGTITWPPKRWRSYRPCSRSRQKIPKNSTHSNNNNNNKQRYVFSASDFRNLKSVVRPIKRLACGGKLWCSLLSGIVALQATFGANWGLEIDKFLFVALVAISKHLLAFSCVNFHFSSFHSSVFVKKYVKNTMHRLEEHFDKCTT